MTDISGRSMKAEFLRVEGGKAYFQKDGAEVAVPLERLADDDRARIEGGPPARTSQEADPFDGSTAPGSTAPGSTAPGSTAPGST
jgi:hypothetical protein